MLTPSSDLYGSDRSLLGALPALAERFDVSVFAATDGPLIDRARDLGVDVRVTADWALRRHLLRPDALPSTARAVTSTLRLLRQEHRARPFVAVYANTIANVLLPALPAAVPAPLVVHVREVPRDRARAARVLLGAAGRGASLVLCNSAFTASLVEASAPSLAARCRVVPNGVERVPTVSRAAAQACDRPTAADPLRVVCVARIHPKKGHAVLLAAVGRAVRAGVPIELHLWGDALDVHRDLERDLRRRAVEEGLGDSVHWHGYGDDVAELYRDMDVAVVPSVLSEEFSRVTVEAQLAGLPVIATGPGGPSEIIDDGRTGRIVPQADVDALAAALVELADPARRRTWAQAASRHLAGRYTVAEHGRLVASAVEAVSRPAVVRSPAGGFAVA